MAQLTKSWTFNTDSQGWTAHPSGLGTATFQAAKGNPAGCLSVGVTGKNQTASPSWGFLDTWINIFGVPANSNVVAIGAAGDGYQSKCDIFTTGVASTDGSLGLQAGITILTLVSSRTFSATDATFVNRSVTLFNQAIPATNQPASSTVNLTLGSTLKTGSSASANVELLWDNITLTVFYVVPGVIWNMPFLPGFGTGR